MDVKGGRKAVETAKKGRCIIVCGLKPAAIGAALFFYLIRF